MKKVIHSPLWVLLVMAGLLGCMPAIPRHVTFIDSNPRWSWEGQWEGRGGMTFDFVQEGSHISFRKQVLLSVVSMDAEVTENRAVGTYSTSNPDSPTLASPPDSQGPAATLNTVASALNAMAQKLSGVAFPLSLVMSDDGMFLKGEVSDPITHEITFRRIGSLAALTTEQGPSEVAGDEPDDDEEAAAPGSGHGYLGIEIQDFTQPASVPNATSSQEGALVNKIVPGFPADQAGIQVGDIVTAVNGLPTRNAKALASLIRQLRRGDRVTLDIQRKGSVDEAKRLRLAAVVSELADPPSPNEVESGEQNVLNQAQPATGFSHDAMNVYTIERFQTWTHDNAYAAEQKLQAMGMINIRGRVDRVSAKDITLVGDIEIHPKIVCQFRELPRLYGQPFSYATPAEASSLRRDDLVTVAARFRKYPFPSKSTALFEDCRIVQIVPAAQAPRAQTSAPQTGAVSQAPTGGSQSLPPAGYYQCYRLTVAISANSCKVGDLQLDGQGNYSSTAGAGGAYVFDPAAGVVSFNGGMLNGRMALAKISSKGTYMLRMRPDGNGLPSPRQTFGTYTFEHKGSGHRERW